MLRAMNSSSNVSIGPASILGWLAAAAGLLTTAVQSLENSNALTAGPGKWPAILGVAALIATNAGRQFQAAHLTKAATVAGDVAAVPTELQALAAEAQANLAKLQASPDGIDGPHVAFSGQPEEGQPAPAATGAPAPPAPPAV